MKQPTNDVEDADSPVSHHLRSARKESKKHKIGKNHGKHSPPKRSPTVKNATHSKQILKVN